MTNELEKQFFNTFNIEPIGCNDNKNCTGALDCTQCPNAKYPQITDRILLELICIDNQMKNIKVLKAFTLDCLIKEYERNAERIVSTGACQKVANELKHQVRTLFEEGKNDKT